MTELPNSVTEAQAQLHAAMKRSTDPRWVESQLSPKVVREPRSYGWLIWPALVLGFLAVCAIASI